MRRILCSLSLLYLTCWWSYLQFPSPNIPFHTTMTPFLEKRGWGLFSPSQFCRVVSSIFPRTRNAWKWFGDSFSSWCVVGFKKVWVSGQPAALLWSYLYSCVFWISLGKQEYTACLKSNYTVNINIKLMLLQKISIICWITYPWKFKHAWDLSV